MKIVIPIAGRGSRFKEAGYKKPKPLIKIRGKEMVKWATDSIKDSVDFRPEDLIFIVLKRDVDEHQIDHNLREMYSDKINIIFLEGITEGAACTVLLAKDLINNDEELVIYNADQYFKYPHLANVIKNKNPNIKGIILTFKATDRRWSYVKLDENGYVIRAAEKIPISINSTVGFYYFTHGKDFVWAAEEMIRKDLRRGNEFFVCPTYNQLIERGDKIITSKVDIMWGLGSPEEVLEFEKYFKGDLDNGG